MSLLNHSDFSTGNACCPISFIGSETHKVVNAGSFHTTPNTSLGTVQATPSRVQPSPTVHTKEALGFIMNMFQAPTLPDISDDKDEWPSLDQNEDAFEAQFQSNTLFKRY